MSGFIAVHVGAGYHAENKRLIYKNTCKRACEAAAELLQQNSHATEAVAEAVSVLENCPSTNAGVGSNLTLSGVVECDAGIMTGESLHFGSVGALPGIKNPIKVALRVLQEQQQGLSHGRIPPCTIVGQGATEWAAEKGCSVLDGHKLTTKDSRMAHLKNISILRSPNNVSLERSNLSQSALDTVGAVCVDSNGIVASAVSSGGLLLKHTGRIGQAATYGAGCWAQNATLNGPSIAVSTTGIGEYLIKTLLAKECYETIRANSESLSVLHDILKNKFLDSPFLRGNGSKFAGVLAVKHYAEEKHCELTWAHNTETMVLGYMSTSEKKPVALVSVQPENSVCEESIVAGEKHIKLS